MAYTYDDFIKWAVGQKASALDYDKIYGLQCVDFIKWYVRKVFDFEPQSIGNAIEYYNKRNQAYVQRLVKGGEILTFKKGDKPKPKKGDIVVFYNDKHPKTGHIAIATGNNTTTGFYAYETNFVNENDKWDKCELVFHKYTSTVWCICLLRPDNKYTGVAKASEKVYYVRTSGKNLNLRDSSLNNIIASIPNGTVIELIDAKVKGWYHITAMCTDKKKHTGYASSEYVVVK